MAKVETFEGTMGSGIGYLVQVNTSEETMGSCIGYLIEVNALEGDKWNRNPNDDLYPLGSGRNQNPIA